MDKLNQAILDATEGAIPAFSENAMSKLILLIYTDIADRLEEETIDALQDEVLGALVCIACDKWIAQAQEWVYEV